jgi:hypothetical protein
VERPGDAGAFEGLRGAVLLAQRHQTGHLVLGESELVATGLGEAQVGNLEVKGHVRGHDRSNPFPEGCADPA